MQIIKNAQNQDSSKMTKISVHRGENESWQILLSYNSPRQIEQHTQKNINNQKENRGENESILHISSPVNSPRQQSA